MNIVETIKKNIADKSMRFHTITETNMLTEAITCFENKMYYASATILACLYEKVFTTRLIRETSFPSSFTPSKSNIQDQLDYILDRTVVVTDGTDPSKKRGWSFKVITQALENEGVLTSKQRETYNGYYDSYRVPILHGLDNRLFCEVFSRDPHIFEADTESSEIHRFLTVKLFELINDLYVSKLINKEK